MDRPYPYRVRSTLEMNDFAVFSSHDGAIAEVNWIAQSNMAITALTIAIMQGILV